jgi:hypothetical protein
MPTAKKPAMRRTGLLCEKHGGSVKPYDAMWCCDECAIVGYLPCVKCNGNARGFGEALFAVAGCEMCDEFVCGTNVDVRMLWNAGVRGKVN